MDDYIDAAQRHYRDGKLLHEQSPPRLANASHLYGLAAECALKAIMRKDLPGTPFGGSTGHIPALFREFKSHKSAKDVKLLTSVNSCALGLKNWGVQQRYQAEAAFGVEVVAEQEESARKLLLLRKNHERGI